MNEKSIPAFCTQCRSRCGCMAIVIDDKLDHIEPLKNHPSGSKLCPKGVAAPELVYHQDRLTHPLRRTSAKGADTTSWEAISWDEALQEISENMGRIREKFGAEQVAFSVTTPSGSHISDSISWIERFIRAFGSPNTIYGTEICNWHKDIASRFTYGYDIGTPDFAHTDCILLWGHNPTATWLARSTEVINAKRRGAKLIVVDPKPTILARRADCWLRVKPGTDQALALGIANLLIEQGGFDEGFLCEWTNAPFLVRSDNGRLLREADLTQGGSAETLIACSEDGVSLRQYNKTSGRWIGKNDVGLHSEYIADTHEGKVLCRTSFSLFSAAAAELPVDRVEALTGVAAEDVRLAVSILKDADTTAYYTWNGVGQSLNATQTDRAISLLYTLTGSYGDKGGNIPGGAAVFADMSGADLISDEQKEKALGLQKRPLGPGRSGWVTARDVYRAIIDQDPYAVRMLFSFGGNLLAAQPDINLGKQAMKKLEFHVHTDFFINASAEYADIVLPVATSWEREGLRTGFDVSIEGMRRVQLRPPVIKPMGEARSDTDIVLGLAAKLGLEKQLFDGDVDQGHDYILAPAGLDVKTLRANPEGVTVATKVCSRAFEKYKEDGSFVGFPTASKRIELYSEQLLESHYDPIPTLNTSLLPKLSDQYPLRLSGAKTVAYCHSQHRNIASLRRLMPDPILELSLEIAEANEISNGDWLEIVTSKSSFVAVAKIIKGLEPGTVVAQHGWWVSGAKESPYTERNQMRANVNRAIDTAVSDEISGSIPLRSSVCNIIKI